MTFFTILVVYLLLVRALSKDRYIAILTALDAFLFAIVCLGNVKHGECASSAVWDCKRANKWQGRVFVPLIDKLMRDPDHCEKSWTWQSNLYRAEPV